MTTTSEALTRGIRVKVRAHYVSEHSSPDRGLWFFVYTVRIENEGDERAQLLSRHWVITDANGKVEEVQGPGVIGEQPVIDPGEHFEYISACPLSTPFGSMSGTYQMVTPRGDLFDVEIAPFALSEPYSVN
jgi:ApaG protein